jgi:hypothetical protein
MAQRADVVGQRLATHAARLASQQHRLAVDVHDEVASLAGETTLGVNWQKPDGSSARRCFDNGLVAVREPKANVFERLLIGRGKPSPAA